MISYLKGKVIFKLKNNIVLEVGNVGYTIFVSDNFLNELKVNQIIEIFTHQHVKEDALDLYGFKSLAELEFFKLLISISGVGPRSALSVLAIANLKDIKESIIRGDSNLLIKVSGIGKRTAERIILELKDKIFKIEGNPELSDGLSFSSDEIDTLIALGYTLTEARDALNKVDKNIEDSGKRLKEALKKLAK